MPMNTKITANACAPGSTMYVFGIVSLDQSPRCGEDGWSCRDIEVADGLWQQGDVLVAGISYDSGPGDGISASFPSEDVPVTLVRGGSPVWVSPQHAMWSLNGYFGEWMMWSIDIPAGFPAGRVNMRLWGGMIDADQPLTQAGIRWGFSEPIWFDVSPTAAVLPKFTVSKAQWSPPGAVGVTSWLQMTMHSSIPSNYCPYMFSGMSQDEINALIPAQFRSTRHPANVWVPDTGGGGNDCRNNNYSPPNGNSGQPTWQDWANIASFGYTPSHDGAYKYCVCVINMPNGL